MMVARSSPATAAASRSAAAGSAARASLPALMTADQGSPPAPGSKVKTVSTFGSRSRASAIFPCCSVLEAMTTRAPESRMMYAACAAVSVG